MIKNQDRSGWFGASDTCHMMGSFQTRTFARFWLEKQGLRQNQVRTPQMLAGTAYEHRILAAIGVRQMDRQIKKRSLRLRVNLDGETPERIEEVKTHAAPVFHLSRAYWMQAQVEMFAANKPLEIVAYRLEPEDYGNCYRPIDPERITRHPVLRDEAWLQEQYLPRLRYLAWCLKRGVWPNETGIGCGGRADRVV